MKEEFDTWPSLLRRIIFFIGSYYVVLAVAIIVWYVATRAVLALISFQHVLASCMREGQSSEETGRSSHG